MRERRFNNHTIEKEIRAIFYGKYNSIYGAGKLILEYSGNKFRFTKLWGRDPYFDEVIAMILSDRRLRNEVILYAQYHLNTDVDVRVGQSGCVDIIPHPHRDYQIRPSLSYITNRLRLGMDYIHISCESKMSTDQVIPIHTFVGALIGLLKLFKQQKYEETTYYIAPFISESDEEFKSIAQIRKLRMVHFMSMRHVEKRERVEISSTPFGALRPIKEWYSYGISDMLHTKEYPENKPDGGHLSSWNNSEYHIYHEGYTRRTKSKSSIEPPIEPPEEETAE